MCILSNFTVLGLEIGDGLLVSLAAVAMGMQENRTMKS